MQRSRFRSSSHGEQDNKKSDDKRPTGLVNNIVYYFNKFRKDLLVSLKTYWRLLGYARPHLHLVLFVAILSIISSFIAILPSQIMGLAVEEIRSVDTLQGKRDTSIQVSRPDSDAPSGTRRKSSLTIAPAIYGISDYVFRNWMPNQNPSIVAFYILASAYMVFYIVNSGISVTRSITMAKLGQTLIYDMRNHIYRHIQSLSLRFFEDRRTGDIMSRIVNDVNSLQSVMVGPVIRFVTDFLKLFWILYLCIRWDWKLTLLALVVGPILIPTTLAFGMIMRRIYRLVRKKVGELNSIIQDNISGIRIIKGFAREEHELRRFSKTNDENRHLHIRASKISAIFGPSMSLLMQVGSLMVLALGGIKVLKGEMEVGVFIVFFPYVKMLYGPLSGITGFYSYIMRAMASVERVFEIIDTVPEVTDKPDAIDLPVIKGEVELKNVCFSYSEDSPVLNNINIKANPGQMVAFVGPSGAGKTTAVNLVARFYDPTSGDILVDGFNLKDIKQNSLRSQMGIVSQEPFLFNDTIKASIAYGKLGATDQEIYDAAKAANAHRFIVELPKGYDTVIGERGAKLSGGQKQRVSIARAILADSRILILDEATSSVDTETEMMIQSAIQRLVKNRTTFVIAHRLSTVHNADLIVVLDKGNVVEMGNHEELLTIDGLYSRLYKVQFMVPDEDGNKPQELNIPKLQSPSEEIFTEIDDLDSGPIIGSDE